MRSFIITIFIFAFSSSLLYAEYADENSPLPAADLHYEEGTHRDEKHIRRSLNEIQAELKQELQHREKSEILRSINELQASLRQEIQSSKKKIAQSTSEAEKTKLAEKLQELDRQLSTAGEDFERIATGVDSSIFKENNETTFNWQKEIRTLIEPAIKEMKMATIHARKKTALKETIAEYEKHVPVAEKALNNLNTLISNTEDKRIKKQLQDLLPDWQNVAHRAKNKLELSRLELEKMEEEEDSLLKTSRDSVKNFFRSRGLYLIIALAVFLLTYLLSRLVFQLMFKFVPCFSNNAQCLHVRLMELLARISTLLLATFGFLFVLYQVEDWTLLSLSLIFFLGLSWAIRNTIPQLWKQGRILLNIGSVREGERIVIDGIPWLIKKLHFFCDLVNPALDVHLRIPIEDMVGKISRPVKNNEPWFPCREDDWVLLSDSMRGKVISLSHEMVEIVEKGGAHKTYQTQDFLSLSPLNLSRNFRLRVPFGISYTLQNESTTGIRDILVTSLTEKIAEEGYSESLLNLQVEFNEAGSSSLDLIVLADFQGEMAPLYKKLQRNIQRWCVDTCTANNWEIPFPQRTIHWPAKEKQLEKSGQEPLS